MEDFQDLIKYGIPRYHNVANQDRVAQKDESNWPPKCCKKIPQRTILAVLKGDAKTQFTQKRTEYSTKLRRRTYCHDPACATFIPQWWFGCPQVACPARKCRQWTCTLCKGNANSNHCTKAARELRELNAKLGYQKCPGCSRIIEHIDGCQQMTCPCGTRFCYCCGKKLGWCECTMRDLARIRNRVQNNTSRRLLEDEAEDVMEAIRLVGWYEAQGAAGRKTFEKDNQIALDERLAAGQRRMREQKRGEDPDMDSEESD